MPPPLTAGSPGRIGARAPSPQTALQAGKEARRPRNVHAGGFVLFCLM